MDKILGGFTVVNRFMLSNRKKIPRISNIIMNRINSHPHSLYKCVNSFFILFIFGIIVLAGGIYYYTGSYPNSLINDRHGEIGDIKIIISAAQKGLIGLTLFVLSGICFIWYYLQKFVLTPLSRMKDVAEQIINGRLDQTIKMDAPLELIRLYDSINDLSVNLQEILLFVWIQTENSLRCLDGDECEVIDSDLSTAGINAIKKNMLELQKMVSSFTLYDVRVEEKRIVDGSGKG